MIGLFLTRWLVQGWEPPPKTSKKVVLTHVFGFILEKMLFFARGGGHALEEIGQKMPRLKNFFLAISEGFKKEHFVLLKKNGVFVFFKKTISCSPGFVQRMQFVFF